jgi:HSP20 family protein
MFPILKTRAFFPDIDDFFGDETLAEFFGKKRGVNIPSVNVIDAKNEFKIEVAAPGLDKEDFKIELNNNVLTISSDKEEKSEENDQKYTRREFCYTCFKRSFTLPNTVDSEKISANHKNGILYVSIPKRDEAKEREPRNIFIA